MRSTMIQAFLMAAVLPLTAHFSAVAGELTLSGTPAAGGKVGQPYSFKPTVTNGIPGLLQFSYINKPSWATPYRGSGLVAGTPAQAGVWKDIQIVATDGIHYAWSKPFSITITSDSAQVAISGTPATTALIGQPYAFTPTLVATTDSKWTYSIKNLPSWAKFNPATGTLSGTPATTVKSSYENIVIGVSNGTASAALPAFGIAVTAKATGTANLSWSEPAQNPNESASSLAGYLIRYGTDIAALNKEITITSARATSAEIENLAVGVWYFEVAAVNSAHVVGRFSAIVDGTIR